MKSKIKYFLAGFVIALLLGVGVIVCFFASDAKRPMTYYEQAALSGSKIKLVSFNLSRGMEHGVRYASQDCFYLEYICDFPYAPQEAKDKEALDVFELIRPVSELWRFKTAVLSAYPTTARKGLYDIYTFIQTSDGKWNVDRKTMKVHVND